MILLRNTQIVLIIKDLVTLGSKFTDNKHLLLTTPDDHKTRQKDESKFVDKNGNPISKVLLKNRDIIGTTNRWETDTTKRYYSGYDGVFGTFHFAFMKKEFVQYYRSNATGGSGVAPDDLRNQLDPKERAKNPALSWYIPVLSPESPVKCFK